MTTPYVRRDELDPLPYDAQWPSLRSATGRVDIHSLAAFWVRESKLEGTYLEFGVGAGRSAIAAVRANTRYNAEAVKSFFLFDSFEGLPPLRGPDAGSAQFQEGQFAFSQEDVLARFHQHGVSVERLHLVPGFYEKSLARFDVSRFHGKKAAIVHIDVDLYTSAAVVLRFLTPFLQEGTVLLFDDWNTFTARWSQGERRATREWIEEHPHLTLESYAKYGWHGEAFLVQMSA